MAYFNLTHPLRMEVEPLRLKNGTKLQFFQWLVDAGSKHSQSPPKKFNLNWLTLQNKWIFYHFKAWLANFSFNNSIALFGQGLILAQRSSLKCDKPSSHVQISGSFKGPWVIFNYLLSEGFWAKWTDWLRWWQMHQNEFVLGLSFSCAIWRNGKLPNVDNKMSNVKKVLCLYVCPSPEKQLPRSSSFQPCITMKD